MAELGPWCVFCEFRQSCAMDLLLLFSADMLALWPCFLHTVPWTAFGQRRGIGKRQSRPRAIWLPGETPIPQARLTFFGADKTPLALPDVHSGPTASYRSSGTKGMPPVAVLAVQTCLRRCRGAAGGPPTAGETEPRRRSPGEGERPAALAGRGEPHAVQQRLGKSLLRARRALEVAPCFLDPDIAKSGNGRRLGTGTPNVARQSRV